MSLKSMSMTDGNIRKLIFNFAWPVFISSIFNELYNVTNSLIVGNYVSLKALSAVSACTWICNIFNFTFYGLGMGTGIIIARYHGANDSDNLTRSIESAVIFAIFGGLLLTIISELFLPQLMYICNISGDIYEYAKAYLRVYLLGNCAVLTSQICFYILRSFGDTRHQLYYSIVSSIINIVLGVILVRFFNLDIIGTSIATIISQFVTGILALRQIFRLSEVNIDLKHLNFSFGVVRDILVLGIPAGFQNMLIAISSVMVQSYVNTFPNEVIAGIGVGEKIANWAQMPSVAVSAATMSLVAANIGAQKYDRVKKIIKESEIMSTLTTLLFVVVIFVLAPYLVAGFSDSVEAVNYGIEMIRYSIFGMITVNFSHIYNAACRGAGNVKVPMYVAIIGQVIAKYLFVFIGLKLFYDVRILYLGTAFGFTVAGLLATIYFYRSSWTYEHHMR